MKKVSLLILILSLLSQNTVLSEERKDRGKHNNPVAIVCFIEGNVFLINNKGAKITSIKLFDLLYKDSKIKVNRKSKIRITLVDGERFEISGKTTFTLANKKYRQNKRFTKLPAVTAIPRLKPIVKSEMPGIRQGAIRVRLIDEENITDPFSRYARNKVQVYPFNGAAVLPDKITLNINPQIIGPGYSIVIEDDRGASIYKISSRELELSLPIDLFTPGATYFISVNSAQDQHDLSNKYHFRVLADYAQSERNELRDSYKKQKTIDMLFLLIYFDNSLGLWREACQQLQDSRQFMNHEDLRVAAWNYCHCEYLIPFLPKIPGGEANTSH